MVPNTFRDANCELGFRLNAGNGELSTGPSYPSLAGAHQDAAAVIRAAAAAAIVER